MSTAHGGKRAGAGRKTDAVRKQIKNGEFDEKAAAALPDLFETIMDLAKGVKVAVYKPRKGQSCQEYVDDEGAVVYVYSEPPDKACVMYLVDRASGKAAVKQNVETDTTIQIISNIPRPPKEEPDAE